MSETDQSVPRLNAVWGWAGLDIAEIIDFGFFGDVLAVTASGAVWAVNPSQSVAHFVTDDTDGVAQMRTLTNPCSEAFRGPILEELKEALGLLGPGDVYAMQYPLSVGGKVEVGNFKVEPFWDYHIRMSELGQKLRDAGPDALLMVAQDHDGRPLLEPIGSGPDTARPAQAKEAAPQPKNRSLLGKVLGAFRSKDQ